MDTIAFAKLQERGVLPVPSTCSVSIEDPTVHNLFMVW